MNRVQKATKHIKMGSAKQQPGGAGVQGTRGLTNERPPASGTCQRHWEHPWPAEHPLSLWGEGRSPAESRQSACFQAGLAWERGTSVPTSRCATVVAGTEPGRASDCPRRRRGHASTLSPGHRAREMRVRSSSAIQRPHALVGVTHAAPRGRGVHAGLAARPQQPVGDRVLADDVFHPGDVQEREQHPQELRRRRGAESLRGGAWAAPHHHPGLCPAPSARKSARRPTSARCAPGRPLPSMPRCSAPPWGCWPCWHPGFPLPRALGAGRGMRARAPPWVLPLAACRASFTPLLAPLLARG